MTRIIPALVLGMVEEASSSAHSDVSPFWQSGRRRIHAGMRNSGPALVHVAASSYAEGGMSEEAVALRRMREQYARTPLDHDRIEASRSLLLR